MKQLDLKSTDKPVSIKSIECSIVDYGWEKAGLNSIANKVY